MKRLRLVALGTVSCLILVGASLGACSSDDTSVDPGTDAGRTETSPGVDAQSDTSTTDAPVDSPIDTGVTAATIADAIAGKMCSALARCCFGNANPPEGGADGGTFDRQACLDLYSDLGFENSSVGHAVFGNGKVELDQAKVAECFQKIDTLACTLTGTALQDIRSSCFAAIKGTVPSGQPCAQSAECATGLFCLPTSDAGPAGTCSALRTATQACGLFGNDSVKSEEACSYRGSGSPALRCDSLDPANPQNYTDPSVWTCKPTVANGQPCDSTAWCTSGICEPGSFTCVSMTTYFSKFSCEAQVTP
jgi:hypothetical protein